MERYGNLSKNSGVLGCEIGEDFIKVLFADGLYLYNYAVTGKSDVDTMKTLAASGRGLSSYISRHVGNRYAAKSQVTRVPARPWQTSKRVRTGPSRP